MFSLGMLLIALLPGGCLPASTFVSPGMIALDETVSRKFEKDCSMWNLVGDDATYCRERLVPNTRPVVYCFKTLGGVECHNKPDPYDVASANRFNPQQPLAAPQTPSPEELAEAKRVAAAKSGSSDMANAWPAQSPTVVAGDGTPKANQPANLP